MSRQETTRDGDGAAVSVTAAAGEKLGGVSVHTALPPVRSWLAHLGLLGLSGLLLALAFPPFSLRWLGYVALLPLVCIGLRSIGGRRLWWTAMLMSFAWWAVTLHWMYPVTGGGYLALALYLALYWPLSLFALRTMVRRYRWPITFAWPFVWVSLEWVRGIFLAGGFSWYTLAHTQASATPGDLCHVLQVADLFGEWGVSFIIAMTTGFLAQVGMAWQMRQAYRLGGGMHGGEETVTAHESNARGSDTESMSPSEAGSDDALHARYSMRRELVGVGSAWLLVMIAAASYGGWRVSQWHDRDSGVTLPGPTVTIVQTNVKQSNKDSPYFEQLVENWRDLVRVTGEGLTAAREAGQQPDVVVWPETMVPFPLNDEARAFLRDSGHPIYKEFAVYADQAIAVAKRMGIPLVVGAHAKYDWRMKPYPSDPTQQYPDSARTYNAAFVFDSRGDLLGRYDKVERVPFGEFVPWVESWPWLKQQFIRYLTPYDSDYSLTPGDKLDVIALPYQNGEAAAGKKPVARMVIPICFEDTIGRLTRRMAYENDGAKRADVFINLTNDGWFAGSPQPGFHVQVAAIRCIESRIPMARSVNTGISCTIDSLGRVDAVIDVDGEREQVAGAVTATLRLDRRATLFGLVGQWPIGLLSTLCGALVFTAWGGAWHVGRPARKARRAAKRERRAQRRAAKS